MPLALGTDAQREPAGAWARFMLESSVDYRGHTTLPDGIPTAEAPARAFAGRGFHRGGHLARSIALDAGSGNLPGRLGLINRSSFHGTAARLPDGSGTSSR